MCDPVETAPSFGDGTHAVWHGQRRQQTTDYAQSVVHYVPGLRAWPIDKVPKQERGHTRT